MNAFIWKTTNFSLALFLQAIQSADVGAYLQFPPHQSSDSRLSSQVFTVSQMPTPPPPEKFLGDDPPVSSTVPTEYLIDAFQQSGSGTLKAEDAINETEMTAGRCQFTSSWDFSTNKANPNVNIPKNIADHKELIQQHQIHQKALLQHHKQQRSLVPRLYAYHRIRSFSQKSLLVPIQISGENKSFTRTYDDESDMKFIENLENDKLKSQSTSQLSKSVSYGKNTFESDLNTNSLLKSALNCPVSIDEIPPQRSKLVLSDEMSVNATLRPCSAAISNLFPNMLSQGNDLRTTRHLTPEDILGRFDSSINDLQTRTLPTKRKNINVDSIKLNPITLKLDRK